MSGTKYSSLPDIDTAPDIYETPDTFQTPQDKDELQEEEALNTRSGRRNLEDLSSREDLDQSGLPDSHEVGMRFRRAERRRGRFREIYTNSTSPNGSPSRSPSPSGTSSRKVPPQVRLERLRAELEQLELELANPSETDTTAAIDPSAMMHGLTEIRGRLNNIGTGETRSTTQKLLSRVVPPPKPAAGEPSGTNDIVTNGVDGHKPEDSPGEPGLTESDTLLALDRRLGELELMIGASNAALDESSPLPQPLIPHITRLSNVLTLLTQPRQIDAVSRRLKLLQTDLERYSAAQNKRLQHQSSSQQPQSQSQTPSTSLASHDIALVLQRLGPALPTIPHLLTRLRTLSTLHASASGFASSLAELEEEQRRTHASLDEISRAVDGLEKSFDANAELVAGNLAGLQERLEAVQHRLVKSQR